jgi:hypothetical protein
MFYWYHDVIMFPLPYDNSIIYVTIRNNAIIGMFNVTSALADRLSRPKSNRSSDSDSSKQKKKTTMQVMPGVNPLIVQVAPSKPTDKCMYIVLQLLLRPPSAFFSIHNYYCHFKCHLTER